MIQIGTSGFLYADWAGHFYPKETHPDDYFTFYSREFFAVELAVSDFNLTGPDSLAQIIREAPDGFLFSIEIRPVFCRKLNDDVAYLNQLLQMVNADKIVCALISYPETFTDIPENRETLVWLREQLEIPLVVELLSRKWIKEGIKEWFLAHSLGFCCSDLPRLPGMAPPVDWVTGPIAYIRFHGRNYEKWVSHSGKRDQYDHSYSMMELAEWLPKIEDMNNRADQTLVMMHNTPLAQAVESARLLEKMLGLSKGRSQDATSAG